MALESVFCDLCGTEMQRENWDGQYYIQDYNCLWSKIDLYTNEETDAVGLRICSEDCWREYDQYREGPWLETHL